MASCNAPCAKQFYVGNNCVPIDSPGAPRNGIFFVNGVRNTECECNETAQTLFQTVHQALVDRQRNPAHYSYGVVCSHNDTYFDERFILSVVSLVAGVFAASAAMREAEQKKMIRTAIWGAIAVACIAYGIVQVNNIPSTEAQVSDALVSRVQKYLGDGRNDRIAILVVHSHGAVIGGNAHAKLSKVREYAGKVRLICLGGAVKINSNLPQFPVSNIHFHNDPVYRILGDKPTKAMKELCLAEDTDEVLKIASRRLVEHRVCEYLKADITQAALVNALAV